MTDEQHLSSVILPIESSSDSVLTSRRQELVLPLPMHLFSNLAGTLVDVPDLFVTRIVLQYRGVAVSAQRILASDSCSTSILDRLVHRSQDMVFF